MVFAVREGLIRQKTPAINALRGHLTEFGPVVPQGAANAARLIAIVEDPDRGLPLDAIATLKVLALHREPKASVARDDGLRAQIAGGRLAS
jgi:hypothetical protein